MRRTLGRFAVGVLLFVPNFAVAFHFLDVPEPLQSRFVGIQKDMGFIFSIRLTKFNGVSRTLNTPIQQR